MHLTFKNDDRSRWTFFSFVFLELQDGAASAEVAPSCRDASIAKHVAELNQSVLQPFGSTGALLAITTAMVSFVEAQGVLLSTYHCHGDLALGASRLCFLHIPTAMVSQSWFYIHPLTSLIMP